MMSRRGGVTLIELIIYVGIFAGAATLFTGITVTLTRVQTRQAATIEVSQQAQFVIQTIQRLVTDASLIELKKDTATSTLKLRMSAAAKDPTCIQFSNGVVYLMEGNNGVAKQSCYATSTTQAKTLTDSKVVVNGLTFKKFENPPAKDTVKIDLTISYNSTDPQQSSISRTLQTAITKVSAATFDSDIIPSADNSYDAGIAANRWRNGLFSNTFLVGYTSVTGGIAAFNGNVGIGTNAPSYFLDVSGGFRVGNATTTNAIVYNPGTGNVGIGIANPAATLDVNGAANMRGTINAYPQPGQATVTSAIFSNNADATIRILHSGGVSTLYTDSSAQAIKFSANGSGNNALYISGGNNVGIGTATLSGRLDVKSSGVGTFVTHFTASDGSSLGGLLEDGIGAGSIYVRDELGNSDVLINTNGSSYFNAGSVGIGYAGPGYKLDVNGAINASSTGGLCIAGDCKTAWSQVAGGESGTWSNVTASRALNTVYQNTSGKKRRISVVALADDVGNAIVLSGYVGSSNPPTMDIQIVSGVIYSKETIYIEVPNNWYYKVQKGTVGVTLTTWYELDE